MSEPLHEEERNLLRMFGAALCQETHICCGSCQFADEIDDFVSAFNDDPKTNRAEIAPAREPLPEQRDVEGGTI